ncbi:ribonuclease H-like domain-containing protein [Tanacetum coccineum]
MNEPSNADFTNSNMLKQSPILYHGAPAMSPVPVSMLLAFPHAFHTMALQNTNWNMDTGASSHLADNTVLSLAVSWEWPIHQLDVKNAFLHGHLTKTVYMHQPPGFVDSVHLDYVCHLQRSDVCYADSWLSQYYFLGVLPQRTVLAPHFTALKAAFSTLCSCTKLIMDFSFNSISTASILLPLTLMPVIGCLLLLRRSTLCVALRNLLLELHAPLSTATIVYCDNCLRLDISMRYIFTKSSQVVVLEFSLHPEHSKISAVYTEACSISSQSHLIYSKSSHQSTFINSQQSTVNSQQSTVNSQQSTVNSQQSTVNSQQSTVNSQQILCFYALIISTLYATMPIVYMLSFLHTEAEPGFAIKKGRTSKGNDNSDKLRPLTVLRTKSKV